MNEFTTIKVTKKLTEALRTKKIHPRQSYEDVIWDVLEEVKNANNKRKN